MEDSASVSEFGGDLMDGMLDLEIKPFVSQQIHIVKKWWTEINPNEDANIPNEKVYRFFIAKKISQDQGTVGKDITQIIGPHKYIDYVNFYKIFCLGIFREALIELI